MKSKSKITTDIPADPERFLSEIITSLGNPYDLHSETCLNKKVTIIYLHTIVNQTEIKDHLLTPLNLPASPEETSPRRLTWNDWLPLISEKGRIQREWMEDVLNDLILGRAVIHLNGAQTIYSFDARKIAKRQPTDAQAERSIRAPRITFVETLDDNLSLIRAGIKDIRLRVEKAIIGTRTKTNLAILYLDDLAMPEVIREVKQRLNAFEIDGILDSGYIEQLISDNRWSIFPLAQSTERPDKVMSAVLEGRGLVG